MNTYINSPASIDPSSLSSPSGKFFMNMYEGIRYVMQGYSIFDWWDRFTTDYQRWEHTTVPPFNLSGQLHALVEKEEAEEDPSVYKLPEGVISVQEYDPYVVGMNTLIALGWKMLFCEYIRRLFRVDVVYSVIMSCS